MFSRPFPIFPGAWQPWIQIKQIQWAVTINSRQFDKQIAYIMHVLEMMLINFSMHYWHF